MKFFYSLLCLTLVTLTGWAQSFTGPTSATSGSIITLTAPGENYIADNTSTWYYFTHINGVDESQSIYQNYSSTNGDPKTYVHISLNEVTNIFNPFNNRKASAIKINAVNNSNSPITVTFYIGVQYAYNPGNQTGAVYIPYTLTIQPDPNVPHSGTYAKLIATKVSDPNDTRPYSGLFDISVYFYKYSDATGPLNVTNLPVSYTTAQIGRVEPAATHNIVVSGNHYSLGQRSITSDRNATAPPTPSQLGFTLNPLSGYIIY
jgi:hypothetical protein